MGRELRRVPADWQHPLDDRGICLPLHYESFKEAAAKWKAGFAAWECGDRPDYCSEGGAKMEYWEYDGAPPESKYYRPDWPEESRTHFQMYETTSEGTPISPVFADIETLAHWLADNGASAFAGQTATYEQWLATCQRGWAPSAIHSPQTGLISGVAASL